MASAAGFLPTTCAFLAMVLVLALVLVLAPLLFTWEVRHLLLRPMALTSGFRLPAAPSLLQAAVRALVLLALNRRNPCNLKPLPLRLLLCLPPLPQQRRLPTAALPPTRLHPCSHPPLPRRLPLCPRTCLLRMHWVSCLALLLPCACLSLLSMPLRSSPRQPMATLGSIRLWHPRL